MNDIPNIHEVVEQDFLRFIHGRDRDPDHRGPFMVRLGCWSDDEFVETSYSGYEPVSTADGRIRSDLGAGTVFVIEFPQCLPGVPHRVEGAVFEKDGRIVAQMRFSNVLTVSEKIRPIVCVSV